MKHPSKILLFGEYSILMDSDALAFPYQGFQGEWSSDPSDDLNYTSSRKSLKQFITWLKEDKQNPGMSKILDIYDLEKDFRNGLYFKSDIPIGSGLGSSGAFVAAVFQSYAIEKASAKDPGELRKILSRLENYFHYNSSGIDPLISFLNLPVLSTKQGVNTLQEDQFKNSLHDYGLFLLRSDQIRQSGVYVQQFKDLLASDAGFKSQIFEQYIPQNNQCIASFLSKEGPSEFYACLEKLSSMQSEFFRDLFPEPVYSLMKQGHESGDFQLKLCGSGGGGYFIGFAKEMGKTRKVIADSGLAYVAYRA